MTNAPLPRIHNSHNTLPTHLFYVKLKKTTGHEHNEDIDLEGVVFFANFNEAKAHQSILKQADKDVEILRLWSEGISLSECSFKETRSGMYECRSPDEDAPIIPDAVEAIIQEAILCNPSGDTKYPMEVELPEENSSGTESD